MCTSERNCCVECHFSYEEELALPYLPVPLRARLLDEHRRLEAMGFPDDEVAAHARWEEPVFRLYCPPEVCEQIEDDHVAHGHGKLVSREKVAARRIENPARGVPDLPPPPGVLRIRRVHAQLHAW